MKTDTSYGNFMVKLIWRLCGDLIYNENPRQPLDQFSHKISIKGITLQTVSIQSPH